MGVTPGPGQPLGSVDRTDAVSVGLAQHGDHLEAHTPHDADRPYGWSGWKRWPEFGLHLGEHGGLSRWRGDREARAWPERLSRGKPGEWQWAAGGQANGEPPADHREKQITDAGLEVLERVSRQRFVATVAFNRLRDQKAFLVTKEDRPRADGKPYPVELFEIDPSGPYREGK